MSSPVSSGDQPTAEISTEAHPRRPVVPYIASWSAEETAPPTVIECSPPLSMPMTAPFSVRMGTG